MKTFDDFNIHITGTGEVDTTCPECSPSRKKKSDPCLSVNTSLGTWICHHCGWTGGLGQDRQAWSGKLPKNYKRPEFNYGGLDADATEFMTRRGITPEVCKRNEVMSKDGAILFPFHKDGEVVNIKYRGRGKKFWQSKDGEKIVYGYDDISPDDLVIITEGEMDKLALEVAGFKNAVSVPDGAPAPDAKSYSNKFSFLDNCAERLKEIKHFILAVDGDEPGKKLETELARRLGYCRCSRVEWPEGLKDANDVLIQMGAEALAETIEIAKPYPVDGIIEVDSLDFTNLYENGLTQGVSTGWFALDSLYRLSDETGDLHIVTGIPGHGKSEWLDAMLINLSESEGWNFGIFSPENQPLVQHGAKWLEKKVGLPFKDGFKRRMTLEQMKNSVLWLKEHFSFIYPDEDSLSLGSILELAKALVYRKGIRGLVIDPWNEIDHSREPHLSETEYISKSLSRIRQFARLYNCHVWVVAHPKKMEKIQGTQSYPVPTPYDISGSAHWRNKADYCITVWRDFDSFEVDLHIQKVRRKHLGQIGKATLHYEYSTGRYLEK